MGATADPVGGALASLGGGAAAGAAVISLGLAAFRDVLADSLPLVLFGGIVTSAAVGWAAATAVSDTWRRSVTATLAAFAGVLLAGLTAPADAVAGRIGLVAYGGILAAVAVSAVRAARGARGDVGGEKPPTA